MDQLLNELEARKAALENEYHQAMERYRNEILKLEHEIIERSKALSRAGGSVDMPADGWNVEHEGLVKTDQVEGSHLYERERVFDGGDS